MRCLLCLAFLPFYGFSQNLLVNPGFEEENICSEYKKNCAPEGWIYSVPSYNYYFNDPVMAHGGSRFVAVVAGHLQKSNYRTFVRSRLLCGLQKGNTYEIEFFVKSHHPLLDSVGVIFTSYDFLLEKRPYQKITPSFYLANSLIKPLKEETGWQKIAFQYKANGTEAFLALGNFSKLPPPGTDLFFEEMNFLVQFDDISITPANVNERLCKDWQARREEIYSQDERHDFQDKYMKVYRNNPPEIKNSTTINLHIDTLVIPDVFFATNSFMLNRRSTLLLDSFSVKINKYKLDSAMVYGHTDARGTEGLNKELSWRRASSVASYLEKKTSNKFGTIGMGSDKPVASNQTAAGRQKNRRVEIYLYIKD